MSGEDTHHNVPKHPVAPRLKSGHKTPHIDHHDTYKYPSFLRSTRSVIYLTFLRRQFHGDSLGHESDKWWAKVRPSSAFSKQQPNNRRGSSLDGQRDPPLGSPLPHRPFGQF